MIGSLLRQVFPRRRRESLEALLDRGNELAGRGEHRLALARFDEAVARHPDSAAAHLDRALSLQALGRMDESWAEAEWRLATQQGVRDFVARAPVPQWKGESLEGGLLLLWEQGHGDMLQHLRFIPLAAARARSVSFICPAPLRRLVAASFPELELLPAEGAAIHWERYAAYAPLLSLPFALGVRWSELPASAYLRGGAAREARQLPDSIGIVWKSSAFDPARDCPLEAMALLTGLGRPVVSLQVGASPAERDRLAKLGIRDLGSTFGDYLDTANAIGEVAAVVSVDTSVAHLAGGMGCRVLVALNEPAAVRWMIARDDSPWYPTMRLYRKTSNEAWAGLIRRVSGDLGADAGRGRPEAPLRLNLGCGGKRMPGWVNVDKFGEADLVWDLERFPWPWPTGSAREVLMSHVLEHLGSSSDTFIEVMKELYRVCAPGARIRVSVPHPRHDFFLADPTHVRPILPATLEMFSRRRNLEWQEAGAANTPLALYHGVDFDVEHSELVWDEPYRTDLAEGRTSLDALHALAERSNNVATEIRITLRAVKPGGGNERGG